MYVRADPALDGSGIITCVGVVVVVERSGMGVRSLGTNERSVPFSGYIDQHVR